MQGALTVVTAAVLVGALTSASSAQVPGVDLPQAPEVQVPQAPQVQVPQVTAPSAPAPAPSLPAQPAPQVRLPSPPQPRLPSVSVPRLPVPPQQPSAVAPRPATPASSTSGPGPSGPVAGAGASGSSPRARRAARAARLRGGRGFLRTSYRTRRRLVGALSGCVQTLPTQQRRLLTLRYGVGATDPGRRARWRGRSTSPRRNTWRCGDGPCGASCGRRAAEPARRGRPGTPRYPSTGPPAWTRSVLRWPRPPSDRGPNRGRAGERSRPLSSVATLTAAGRPARRSGAADSRRLWRSTRARCRRRPRSQGWCWRARSPSSA
jgi:hypothetical protein